MVYHINAPQEIPPYVEKIIHSITTKYNVGEEVKEISEYPSGAIRWLLHLKVIEENKKLFRTTYIRNGRIK
jgi:hypothetical protein